MSTQWLSSVDELVDGTAEQDWPGDWGSRCGVELVMPDGQRVQLGERGTAFMHFMLKELSAGHPVRAESTEELLTPDEAGEALGVTRQTIYRWQDGGILPCVFSGKVRAVPASAVAQAVAEQGFAY